MSPSSAFWTIILIVTIVYFDYAQRSCSSLYRLLRFRNCPIYITLHYITFTRLTFSLETRHQLVFILFVFLL